jgi:DNA polymerase-3 subunit delta
MSGSMTGALHALDFLESPPIGKRPPICVLHGGDRFLKSLVIKQLTKLLAGGDDEEALSSVTRFDGEAAEYRDVVDELSTVSMFGGGGPRIAFVDDADEFVDKFRTQLETYLTKPRSSGVLVLVVDTWAANTRVYKISQPIALTIDCRVPEVASSRSKSKPVDEPRIKRWVEAWGRSRHNIQVTAKAQQHLMELIGPEFGMLDQELAKLALFVPAGGKVDDALVKEVVGGWRTKTAWDLNDAIADGDIVLALKQFDQLLQAGQDPQALYGSISWSLRRYAAAARLYREAERRGQRPDLRSCLQQAGFWGDSVDRAEGQVVQIGRQRALKLYRWLLELDLGLKGSHSSEHAARFLLELLFMRLSKPLGPQTRAGAGAAKRS